MIGDFYIYTDDYPKWAEGATFLLVGVRKRYADPDDEAHDIRDNTMLEKHGGMTNDDTALVQMYLPEERRTTWVEDELVPRFLKQTDQPPLDGEQEGQPLVGEATRLGTMMVASADRDCTIIGGRG